MSSVFPCGWLSSPSCKWRSCHRGSLSVCHAGCGRLTQLHIIRRPWIEDSKVLKMAGKILMVTDICPSWHFPYSTTLRPLLPGQGAGPWTPKSGPTTSLRHAPPGLGPGEIPQYCWPFQVMCSLVPTVSAHRLWAHFSVILGNIPPICVTGPYWWGTSVHMSLCLFATLQMS